VVHQADVQAGCGAVDQDQARVTPKRGIRVVESSQSRRPELDITGLAFSGVRPRFVIDGKRLRAQTNKLIQQQSQNLQGRRVIIPVGKWTELVSPNCGAVE